MIVDVCICGKNYLRYESDKAPAINETISMFKPEKKKLLVESVDQLVFQGLNGDFILSVVTVDTKEII